MKLLVIGFPKSGTTSITAALEASGLKPLHWRDRQGRFAGKLIYENILTGRDPFDRMGDYDSVTQADVCLPAQGVNYWPNLDFSVLRAVRDAHPECLFLLNTRDPQKVCASIDKWPQLRQRIVRAAIPGLPAGMGRTDQEIVTWIENHHTACRRYFAKDKKFVEVAIESDDAPKIIGKALGVTLTGWGDVKPDRQGAGRLQEVLASAPRRRRRMVGRGGEV